MNRYYNNMRGNKRRNDCDEFYSYDEPSDPKMDTYRFSERPPLILYHYIRRQSKQRGIDKEKVREDIAEKTGISIDIIREFEGGRIPTSFQLQQLVEGLGWSLFFIFGISQPAYTKAEQMFFDDLGNKSPSSEDKIIFREFYEDFLKVISQDEGRNQ